MDDRPTPAWAALLKTDVLEDWRWEKACLTHRKAPPTGLAKDTKGALHRQIVGRFYADHNNSGNVKRALAGIIARLEKSGGFGINVGAGETALHERILGIDLVAGENIDLVTIGADLPFDTDKLDVAVSQEAIEHIADALRIINEVHRVLKPGGVFYCQVPFIIGFHPGPEDFWRFTRQGMEHLFENDDWTIEELGLSVGHGTGFYRIAVEFFAVTASCLHNALYLPTKGLFALVLYPFKIFDLVTERSAQKDRIPGGYYCIARKRGA